MVTSVSTAVSVEEKPLLLRSLYSLECNECNGTNSIIRDGFGAQIEKPRENSRLIGKRFECSGDTSPAKVFFSGDRQKDALMIFGKARRASKTERRNVFVSM